MRTGKGAAFKAEQFAFEQIRGMAVQLTPTNGPGGPRAVVMDDSREEFLPGAGFAQEQTDRSWGSSATSRT